jgi:hypothetical protein
MIIIFILYCNIICKYNTYDINNLIISYYYICLLFIFYNI